MACIVGQRRPDHGLTAREWLGLGSGSRRCLSLYDADNLDADSAYKAVDESDNARCTGERVALRQPATVREHEHEEKPKVRRLRERRGGKVLTAHIVLTSSSLFA